MSFTSKDIEWLHGENWNKLYLDAQTKSFFIDFLKTSNIFQPHISKILPFIVFLSTRLDKENFICFNFCHVGSENVEFYGLQKLILRSWREKGREFQKYLSEMF